jgi:sugar phosphate isomerase/epimerase
MKKILISLCMLLAIGAITCDAKKKEVAYQMYNLRGLIGNPELYAKNHESVLKQTAQMGYTAVEAASYDNGKLYGVAPEQFKADVEAAGLKVLSSHTVRNLNDQELASKDFTDALKWWDQCIDCHKRAGMKYIVIPWCSVPKPLADLQTICNYYNEVGKRGSAAGMKLGYHSHSHEFQKVEGQVMYDYMIEHTDPAYVFFQMDVYWAVRGQVSPVDYFHKYPGRFTMLHIKDNKEIGQSGMVGFDAIFRNMDVAGTKDWILELEQASTPDILKGMKESIDYIKAAKFVKASYNK